MKQFTVVFPVCKRDEASYILLGQQKPGKPLAGFLNGYGGKVEEGDGSILEAAARELDEELGMPLERPVFIGSIIHQSKEIFFYLSTLEYFEPEDTSEMINNEWYPIIDSDFSQKMLPGDLEIIEHIRLNIDSYFNGEATTEFKIIKEGQAIDKAVQELNKSIGLH